MRRVLVIGSPVIGSPGAEKSTFARELAPRTGLPPVHLGAEEQTGWVRPEQADREARLRGPTAPEARLLGGNGTSSVSLRASRADTVVVPDFPSLLYPCLWRALLNLRPGEMNLGREPLDWPFLKFIWSFPAVQRRQLAGLAAWPQLKVVRLHSDAQARAWPATLPALA